jgi:hypothetical protein
MNKALQGGRFLIRPRVAGFEVTGDTRRPNPSPTNLRPQNRRAELLAFRFCLFYAAIDGLSKTLDFRREAANM